MLFAKYLLGESFHPGGLRLTEELASLLSLSPTTVVLDVASGKGPTGMPRDRYRSQQNVLDASAAAAARGLNRLVEFRLADAEALPFDAASFDAILCEYALLHVSQQADRRDLAL